MARPDSSPLAGLTVLVTRPEYQQQQLISLIEQDGGNPFRFPTIEIAPTEKLQQFDAILQRLSTFDIAIFVSPNAADFVFHKLAETRQRLPDGLKLACVGKGCSRAVEQHGREVDAYPLNGIGSEGLLEHPLLQAVNKKRIVIFRGNGGRDLLAQTLRGRGAEVEYCESYQRKIPVLDSRELIEAWQNHGIDVVTITSTQALTNLWTMLGEHAEALVPSTPMVVISERIAETAKEMGCKIVMTTNDTSDIAVVDCIKQWRMQQIPI